MGYEIPIKVTVDSSGVRSGLSEMERAFRSVDTSINGTDRRLSALDKRTKSLAGSIGSLHSAIRGGIFVGFIAGAASAADTLSRLESQVRLGTKTQAEFAQGMEDVRRIAATTRNELGAVGTLYGKISRNTAQLGISQKQVAAITENVSKALKINGATAGEASSTILQLGQALAAGKLNGDEFRSMMENAPPLMLALAKHMNVPIGQLKELAKEGKLTSAEVAKAFSNPTFTRELEAQFRRIPPTFADVGIAIKNFVTEAAGAFNKGGGFSRSLYDFFNGSADGGARMRESFFALGQQVRATFEALAPFGQLLLGIAKFAGQNLNVLATLAVTYGAYRVATLGASAAMGIYRLATISATTGTLGLNAAIMANPIGAVATVIATVVSAWLLYKNASGQAEDAANTMSGALKFVGDNLRTVAEITMLVMLPSIARMAVALGTTAVVALRGFATSAMGAMGTAAASFRTAGAAATLTTGGMAGLRAGASGLMALFGGPWGLAIGAAVTAIYLLRKEMNEVENQVDSVKDAQKELNKVLADPTATGIAVKSARELLEAERDRLIKLKQEKVAQLEALDAAMKHYGYLAKVAQFLPGMGGIVGAGGALANWYRGDLKADIEAAKKEIEYANRDITAAKVQEIVAPNGVSAWVSGKTSATGGAPTGTGSTGEGSKERYLTPERAIQLLTQSYKSNANLAASENVYAGSYSPGAHSSSSHGTRAVDVNYRGGNGPAEKARLDAEALRLQKLGFTVLWDGKVYAGGGDGPTGNITKRGKGDWQHKRHLHAQANGSSRIKASGLDPSAIADGVADNEQRLADSREEQAKAIEEERKRTEYLTRVAGIKEAIARGDRAAFVTLSDTVQAEQERLIIAELKKKQEIAYSEAQGKIAVDSARAAASAAVVSEEAERRVEWAKQETDLRTRITAAYQNDERATQELADNARVQAAGDQRRWELLEKQVPLTSQIAKDAIAEAEARERSKLALERQATAAERFKKAYDDARQRNDPFGVERDRFANEQRDTDEFYQAERKRLIAAGLEDEAKRLDQMYETVTRDAEQRHLESNARIAENFESKLANSIGTIGDALAQIIGGETGQKIGGAVGGIASLVRTLELNKAQGGSLTNWGSNPQNPRDSAVGRLLGGVDDLNKSLGSLFGKGGELVKGLGKTLGAAGMGASMGAAITPFAKMLWGKFSGTGSQVGGAIGGAIFGPIGGIAGSLLGGIVGGLLSKAPKGKGTVSNTGTSVSANKTEISTAMTGFGDTLQGAVSSIAQRLGGTVGNYSVGIGMYRDAYQVSRKANDPALGKSYFYKKSAYDVYDGKDQAAAMRAAIGVAIEQGAIQGIRESTQRLLQAGKDIEKQLEKALLFEGALNEYKAMIDPVGAALETLNKQMKGLKDIFTEAGASSEEFAQLEALRQKKIKDIIDTSLADLISLREKLRGADVGVPAVTRLNNAMAELSRYEADIAAGKTIDNQKFASVGTEVVDLAREVYGTATAESQAIYSRVNAANEAAIEMVQASADANAAVVEAINTQTSLIQDGNALIDKGNNILQAMLTQMGGTGTVATGSSTAGNTYRAVALAKNGTMDINYI